MSRSSFLQDFKAFAMRGNVVDMAVGIIIGGAFGKIISSMVADIIMPPDRTAGGRDQFLGTEMGVGACPGGQRG